MELALRVPANKRPVVCQLTENGCRGQDLLWFNWIFMKWCVILQIGLSTCGFMYSHCPLSNFEIRRDVTRGSFSYFRRVTIQRACFATIPYTTRACNGNSPEIRNLPRVTITSNLEVGQSVAVVSFSTFMTLHHEGTVKSPHRSNLFW